MHEFIETVFNKVQHSTIAIAIQILDTPQTQKIACNLKALLIR